MFNPIRGVSDGAPTQMAIQNINASKMSASPSEKVSQLALNLLENNLQFQDLNRDTTLLILGKLEIFELLKIAQTSRKNKSYAEDNVIWKEIAEAIGMSDLPIHSTTAPGFAKHHVFLTHKSLCNHIHSLPKDEVPNDIKKDIKNLTVKSINYCQRWIQARDTLVVWRAMAEKIRQPITLSWENSQKMIDQAESLGEYATSGGFSHWVFQNQVSLQALRFLSLEGKKLTYLHPEIFNLTSLQILDLDKNRLRNLPAEIGLLSSLQDLSVEKNGLISVPSEINNLSALVYLGLSKNQLKNLPENLKNMSALFDLQLDKNAFVVFPVGLCNLTAMNLVNLDGNHIETIPDAIANMTALRKLYLDFNQIKTIPNAVKSLPSLKRISLYGNPIESDSVPPSMKQLVSFKPPPS